MNNAVQVQLTRQSAPIIRCHMRALWRHGQSTGDLRGTQFFRFSFVLFSLQTSFILVWGAPCDDAHQKTLMCWRNCAQATRSTRASAS
jgi:hypothetical protein